MPAIGGIAMMVYSEGTNVCNVTQSTNLNWWVRKGLNRLSFYIISSNIKNGSVRAQLKYRNTTVMPITCLGVYHGIANIISDSENLVVPFVDADFNATASSGLVVDLPNDYNLTVHAKVSPTNLDDSTDDYANVSLKSTLSPLVAPYLIILSNSNSTALFIRAVIKVASYNGTIVQVTSSWTNATGGIITLDIQKQAFDLGHGMGYGSYVSCNITIQISDRAFDGAALNKSAYLDFQMFLSARIGSEFKVQKTEIPIDGLLLNSMSNDTTPTTSTNAIQGDTSYIIGPGRASIVYSPMVQLREGMRLSFAANSTPTVYLLISADDVERNITLKTSSSSVWEVSYLSDTSLRGWAMYRVDLYKVIQTVMRDTGGQPASILLEKVVFGSSTNTALDAIRMTIDTTVDVPITYWGFTLSWSTSELGMTVEDKLGSILRKSAPAYCVTFDGKQYTTSNTSWYSVTGLEATTIDDKVVVTQTIWSRFVYIIDTYTISPAGFIVFNRTVDKMFSVSRYTSEKVGSFEFTGDLLYARLMADADITPLVDIQGISLYETGTAQNEFDVDDAEEDVATPYFSNSLSDPITLGVCGTQLQSDGDTVTMTPFNNTDIMFVQFDNLSVSTSMAKYLSLMIPKFDRSRPFVSVHFVGDSQTTWQQVAYINSTGITIIPVSFSKTVDKVRVGADTVKCNASMVLDWVGLRPKQLVNPNNAARDATYGSVTAPYLVFGFNEPKWTDEGSAKLGKEMQLRMANGYTGLFTEAASGTQYATDDIVYMNDSMEVDTYRYNHMTVRYSIPVLDSHAKVYIGLLYGVRQIYWVRLDSGSVTNGFLTQQFDLSYLSPYTITGLALKHNYTGLGSGDPLPKTVSWYDWVIITDGVADYGILRHTYSSSTYESLDAVSDWSATCGTGATVTSETDVGKFSVTAACTANFTKNVRLDLQPGAVLSMRVEYASHVTNMWVAVVDESCVSHTLYLSGGAISNQTEVQLTCSTDVRAKQLLIGFTTNAAGYLKLDYLSIGPYRTVHITPDTASCWTQTGGTSISVPQDKNAVVLDFCTSAASKANYTFVQPASIATLSMLEIEYNLSKAMASHIPTLFIDWAGTPCNPSNVIDSLFIADGQRHTAYVDLAKWRGTTSDRTLKLSIIAQGAAATNDMLMYSVSLVGRSDAWSTRVDNGSTAAYSRTGVDTAGVMRLVAINPPTGFEYGLKTSFAGILSGVARYLSITYHVSSEAVAPRVTITAGSDYSLDLPANLFERTLVIDLKSLGVSITNTNVTAIAIRLKTTSAITGEAWLEVSSIQLQATPVVVYGLAHTMASSSAANWLHGWTYRKLHTIVGATGAGTDYQVRLKVSRLTGTDSGDTVYVGTNCKSDFSDIRITDAGGVNLLNYWLENITGSVARFWVKVTADLGVDQNIYVYYGNSTATSASSGAAVFSLFDDFNRSDSSTVGNGWTEDEYGSGTVSISSNTLQIVQYRNYYDHVECAAPNLSNFAVYGKIKVGTNGGISWRPAVWIYWGLYAWVGVGATENTGHEMVYDEAGTVGSTAVGTPAFNTWYYYRIRVTSSTVYGDYSTDGNTWTNIVARTRHSSWTGAPSLILLGKGWSTNSGSYPNSDLDNNYATPQSSGTSYMDDCYVKTLVATEPSHGAWGVEETRIDSSWSAPEWTSSTKLVRQALDSDGTRYGELDGTAGNVTATWNMNNATIQYNSLFIRWRSIGNSSSVYKMTLTYDGTKSYTISLGSGLTIPTGTSQWYVMQYNLGTIIPTGTSLWKATLISYKGKLQVDYVTVCPSTSYSNDGSFEPDNYTDGTGITWCETGFSTDATTFKFSKVDHFVTNYTVLDMGLVAGSGCTYSVKVYGLDSSQNSMTPQTIPLTTQTGYNSVFLKLGYLLTSIRIITDIEILVSGSTKSTKLGYLTVKDEASLSREQCSTCHLEVYSGGYGVCMQTGSDASVQMSNYVANITATTQMPYRTTSVRLFMGEANFTKSGIAADLVSFLADGLPDTVRWSPPSKAFTVSTNGKDMNLYVDAPMASFTVGENQTQIVLDTMTVAAMDDAVLMLRMTGWLNGVKIQRNYTVTDTGQIQWSTVYGTSTTPMTLESVTVETYLDTEPPITPLHMMESTTGITAQSGVGSLTTTTSLTEGAYSVQGTMNATSGSILVNFTGFELDTASYLHVSLWSQSSGPSFRLVLVNSHGVEIPVYGDYNNDTWWQRDVDYKNQTTTELWIDLSESVYVSDWHQNITSLKVQLCNSTVGKTFKIDDLFISDSVIEGVDSLRWKLYRGTGLSTWGYLSDCSYSDSNGSGMAVAVGSGSWGLWMHSPVVLCCDGGSLDMANGNPITLGASPHTKNGTAAMGYGVNSPSTIPTFGGALLQEGKTADIDEARNLRYVVDLTKMGQVNITIRYWTGLDASCGKPLSIKVSTMNPGYLIGKPGDANVHYLNLTSDYCGAVYMDVLDQIINRDFSPITGITEFPSRFNVTVTVQKGAKPEMHITSTTVTPLIVYTIKVDPATSMLNETYSGIKSGYIENWIASPRDISSSSLWITEPNWWWQGQTGFSRQVYVGSATDVHVQFYLRGDVGLGAEMWFFSIIDKVSGYVFDLRLGDWYLTQKEVRIKERLIGQGYNDGTDLGYFRTATANINGVYTLWTVYLDGGATLLEVDSVDQNTWQVTGTLGVISRPGGLHVNTVTSLEFQAYWDIYAEAQYWNVHVDRLSVLVSNQAWFTEDFNAVAPNVLPGWVNPSGKSTYLRTDYNFNVGDPQPVLGIDPLMLAQSTTLAAKLEFMNGWYKAGRYDVSDSTLRNFISGYNYQLESGSDSDSDRYYQHYYTLLDIKTTGVYKFTIEAPSGKKHDGLLLYVDGMQRPLSSGSAIVYLPAAVHSVYLRIYRGPLQGSPQPINAFRMKLLRDDNRDGVFETTVSDAQSLLVPHGRYTAVYYDTNHIQRYMDGQTPSYYNGSTTPLNNAEILMMSSAMQGVTVSVGAEALAQYMMRDVLAARGGTTSPLITSAGKVLFSCDMVPDTVYGGELDNSLLELFMHAMTYTAVDGGAPFDVVTHRDGSTMVVSDSFGRSGTESVLDLDHTALVYTAPRSDSYNFRDAIGQAARLESNVQQSTIVTPWRQSMGQTSVWSTGHTYVLGQHLGTYLSGGWKFNFNASATSMSYDTGAGGWVVADSSNDGFILPPGVLWFDVHFDAPPPTDWCYDIRLSSAKILSGFYVWNKDNRLQTTSIDSCGVKVYTALSLGESPPTGAIPAETVNIQRPDRSYLNAAHVRFPILVGGSDLLTRKAFIESLEAQITIRGYQACKQLAYQGADGSAHYIYTWVDKGTPWVKVDSVQLTDSYSVYMMRGIDSRLNMQSPNWKCGPAGADSDGGRLFGLS